MRISRDWPLIRFAQRFSLIFAISVVSIESAAAPITLQVKPQRCISLHRGQVCYQNLTFHWSTPDRGEFCLYNRNSGRTLKCWEGAQKTSYQYELKASETVEFVITAGANNEVLARAKVQVASVYRSPERSSSRWRLF